MFFESNKRKTSNCSLEAQILTLVTICENKNVSHALFHHCNCPPSAPHPTHGPKPNQGGGLIRGHGINIQSTMNAMPDVVGLVASLLAGVTDVVVRRIERTHEASAV